MENGRKSNTNSQLQTQFSQKDFKLFSKKFKNAKSSENSCKNNIFGILFKTDFKYTKRRRILLHLLSSKRKA